MSRFLQIQCENVHRCVQINKCKAITVSATCWPCIDQIYSRWGAICAKTINNIIIYGK
jgi:hypothetical protein